MLANPVSKSRPSRSHGDHEAQFRKALINGKIASGAARITTARGTR